MVTNVLPDELIRKATNIAGELAWAPRDARDVIEYLQNLHIAVVGLELWLREGNEPKVIGWSSYDVPFEGDWDSFVQKNAVAAKRELDRSIPDDALINLTWISRADLTKKN